MRPKFEDVRHRKPIRQLLERDSDRLGSTARWAFQDRVNIKAAQGVISNCRIGHSAGRLRTHKRGLEATSLFPVGRAYMNRLLFPFVPQITALNIRIPSSICSSFKVV